METVILKRGHAKPLWAGHPWVHARSVLRVEGTPDPDAPDVVCVADEEGRVLGRGLYSPGSALRVRLLGPGAEEGGVEDLLAERIEAAAALRRRLLPHPSRTDAYRLVHGEGDGLPGLVVERYADLLVAQFATGPMHRRRAFLAERLLAATGARGLVARPGGYEREEGIPAEAVPYALGHVPPGTFPVREAGLWVVVDPHRGQKTGHYVDQRENRVAVAQVAAGGEVLDLFAGTGGFALHALARGARRALAVDASARACATARENAALNGLGAGLEVREGDVRRVLADLKAEGRTWDVVVLDPPNLFPRRGGEGHARKGYRELAVQALLRARPGGFFAGFSCSAKLQAPELRDLLVAAARECRRELRFLQTLQAGPDHPVLGAAREGRYLSGWLTQLGP